MEMTNFVTKKTLTNTLIVMKIGSQLEIKNTDFKEMSVRAACLRLRKRGYAYDVTGANRLDSVVVTRLK